MTDFAPVERDDWLDAPEGLTRIPDGRVTSPEGFVAAGVACGMKTDNARDIGILKSTRPCVSALVDTINALPSAPVQVNRARNRAGFQAVLVNASKANAATGAVGLEDAREMIARAAKAMDLEPDQIAVSSTGTIGERIDLTRALPAIDEVVDALGDDAQHTFAEAICTTDRAIKTGAFSIEIGGRKVTIGIAAKGAGMIRPTMATMLAYLTTDAAVDAQDLKAVTRRVADASFNRISVDGQMSPSDTLLVFANGDGAPLAGADLTLLESALVSVCRWAAIQMVKDGEGADHAVRVQVRGAREVDEAERVARAVGESALVKTAVFGRDPNWGRISQAVGQALARTYGIPPRLDIRIDGHRLDSPEVGEVMERGEYDIQISLRRGVAGFDLWASDLGHSYVTLNAEYHT